MSHERTTPSGFDLRDLAVHDFRREPPHDATGTRIIQSKPYGKTHRPTFDHHIVPLKNLALRGLMTYRLDFRVELRLFRGILFVHGLSLRDFLRLMLELIDNSVMQPFRGFKRVKLREQHYLLVAGLAKTAAKLEHGGSLGHHRGWQVIVDCGEFAIDIIEKSQEPTSYFLFLFVLTAPATVVSRQVGNGYLSYPISWTRVRQAV